MPPVSTGGWKYTPNNLIDLYKAWSKPEKAEKWQAKLTKTEAKIE